MVALHELIRTAPRPHGLADSPGRPAVADVRGDELAPGRDDAGRVPAQRGHVDEAHALGRGMKGAVCPTKSSRSS
jgi:hypothetical protein